MADSGTDVPTDKIIGAVKEHQPAIAGLSARLNLTMARMGEVGVKKCAAWVTSPKRR